MTGLVQGKVAIITGAGSGVGRAASLLFARHGARIFAADIDLFSAQATVAQLQREGGTAIAVKCDVADEAAVFDIVRQTVTEFGRLDIMFNNAGITLEATPARARSN